MNRIYFTDIFCQGSARAEPFGGKWTNPTAENLIISVGYGADKICPTFDKNCQNKINRIQRKSWHESCIGQVPHGAEAKCLKLLVYALCGI